MCNPVRVSELPRVIRWAVVVIIAAAAWGCARASVRPPTEDLSATERAELRRLATDAVTAVVNQDLNWLVAHGRRDLRDPAALQAMQPELESYLFRVVRRIFIAARPLEIRVRSIAVDADGTRWAEVVFFDRATVTDDDLREADFLCKHDLKTAVAWTFRRMTDGWESLGYPFDAFTDIHCPPG